MVRLTFYVDAFPSYKDLFFRMMSSDLFSLIWDLDTLIMAVLVLFFSLIVLRDTLSVFLLLLKFQVLVIPSPGSFVMNTEYEGEATMSTNCLLSS